MTILDEARRIAGDQLTHYDPPHLKRVIIGLVEIMDGALIERTAQITAHRACCGVEHDPANGKLHGCCVVCGVPWPCEYSGNPPSVQS